MKTSEKYRINESILEKLEKTGFLHQIFLKTEEFCHIS